jgi:hypothetical protein
MTIVEQYGQMSGLQVQPTKSFGICLNTLHVPHQLEHIPFLKKIATARYLGIQVGVATDLAKINWDNAITQIQTKLQRATEKSNAPLGRAIILNSVVAPIPALMQHNMPSKYHSTTWDNFTITIFWTGGLHAPGHASPRNCQTGYYGGTS